MFQPWTEDELTVMKQIWALMIHQGRPIDPDADWSIYCGDFDDYWHYVNKGLFALQDAKDKFVKQVKEVGVDFHRTDVPVYECQSEFTDSNSPSKDVHVWTGILQLKDGTQIFVSARDIDLQPLVSRLTTNHEQVDLVKLYFG